MILLLHCNALSKIELISILIISHSKFFTKNMRRPKLFSRLINPFLHELCEVEERKSPISSLPLHTIHVKRDLSFALRQSVHLANTQLDLCQICWDCRAKASLCRERHMLDILALLQYLERIARGFTGYRFFQLLQALGCVLEGPDAIDSDGERIITGGNLTRLAYLCRSYNTVAVAKLRITIRFVRL